ncbi:alpha/beta hydrolase, partial [Streptomyces sp. NPDC006356]
GLRVLHDHALHLVAHSLGGWISANLLAFYPERFASVSLITPVGLRLLDVESIDPFRMTDEEAAAALFNGREADYQQYLDQEGFPDDAVHAFEEATTDALLSWNPRYDWKLDHRLARVQAPTLVIGAEDDRVVPKQMAARFAEVMPAARLVTVSGGDGRPSGHVLHIEQPEDVVPELVAHISAHSKARA